MNISKVLLIDDDEGIRVIARIGLKARPQWQVLLASSGQEGLEKALLEQPDVILLDMTMPEMDGRATFAKLKEQTETKEISVIFMTGKVLPEELESYLALGAAGFIIKPFDPLNLATEIERILAEKSQ